ncbi:putative AraC family transcriptional regulator [Gordonia rhizosphera NBRC 16068]|uniref:Putative AraC family transcriptional regulator n=2 Tax=Gordonia rhizosphera TaxID=83341 RepID=K6VAJ0_9ACTN|nr:putative AraC family transcriptional regulator [Gordonia rhizosphera NBRC 16068]
MTRKDIYSTLEDMSVIRGTSMSGYPELVSELGGDPSTLLRRVGIAPGDVGNFESFFTYVALIDALEAAAAATNTPDFGRRLAQRQGIEILGPVGVAARTTGSFADALRIFEQYLSAYSPAIAVELNPIPYTETAFFEFRILIPHPPPHRQVIELSLGVALKVLRFLLGSTYAPSSVHIPHEPIGSREDYLRYFACTPKFSEPRAGFTLPSSDLMRPLSRDEMAHRAMVAYLDDVIHQHGETLTQAVRELVRQLLPTGAATASTVARQFRLHPKTLQRRLADEGTTYAAIVDDVRRELTERWLRDTDMTLSHLSRELGYSEQSVLTRSCRRWFGVSPAQFRAESRRPAHA